MVSDIRGSVAWSGGAAVKRDLRIIPMFETAAARRGGDLWAITCYFNPAGYRRRLTNYRLFRRHLAPPLLTIELGYAHHFELANGDADVLIQLRGRDVLWQKERLLNLALELLPDTCRKVVWIDCDLIFEASDWAERTSRLLDEFPLVQPFSRLHRMPKEWRPGQRSVALEVRRSLPSMLASGIRAAACFRMRSEEAGVMPGCVWAARREVLQEHRLYDACILGGGDSAIARAAYGCFEDVVRMQRMQGRRRDHYMAWAAAFHRRVGAKVGFVEGDLLHLWHGDQEHRRYYERLDGLSKFDFDPSRDVAMDGSGAWRWNSEKRQMHDFVRDYFASRREDG